MVRTPARPSGRRRSLAAAKDAGAGTYTNPVSRGFADTFADPAVIRARDGWWYAYGTTDPLREGERARHIIPTARSRDLVHWTYVGDAFTESTLPDWAAPDAALWAPDIRYHDGVYHLYYVVTQTTVTDKPNDNAIGVATAPSPTGPWTDSGGPVVGPRRGNSGDPGDFKWTYDPAQFTDHDGTRYLYYGSYYGGIFVTELNADGTRTVGAPTMVAIDNRYEGAYVVRRGRWHYLFASEANCCAGLTTGYTVFTGRSTRPRGPFVDRDGISVLASRVGGTIAVTPNGNTWVGTGHNAVVTDLAGQDWLVYHAIDRRDPYLDEPFGINQRPMLVDRLDWVDGWPTVRAGRWVSQGPQRAPVTDRAAGGHPATPRPAPPPRVGRPVFTDQFDDGTLDPSWTWVRGPAPAATETGNALRWPTQPGDLSEPGGDASALLRDPPAGGYTVETKVEHPPDRVLQGAAVRRCHLLWGHGRRHPGPGDLAAPQPPDRRGQRRARVPGRLQPRRPPLDLGRGLDPARRHPAPHRADLPRRRRGVAEFDYVRIYRP